MVKKQNPKVLPQPAAAQSGNVLLTLRAFLE